MINVVFDLDDTLYSLLPTFEKTLGAMFPDRQFEVLPVYNIFREEGSKLFADSQSGVLSMDSMHRLRAQNAFKRIDIVLSDEQADAFHDMYIKHKQSITLNPSAISIIEGLKSKHCPIGIITNGESHKQREAMKTLGIFDLGIDPNLIIVSGELGIDKPDPRIFKEWTKRVNNPYPTFYIGDNFNHDIIGAHNAQWIPIWYNPHHKSHPEVSFKFAEAENLSDLRMLEHVAGLETIK